MQFNMHYMTWNVSYATKFISIQIKMWKTNKTETNKTQKQSRITSLWNQSMFPVLQSDARHIDSSLVGVCLKQTMKSKQRRGLNYLLRL